MNEVLKAIAGRVSTRGYTDEKLTAEELDALLRAGLESPTATNRQEIHFTVVEGGAPILAKIEEEMLGGRAERPEKNFYYGAPTLILLSAEEAFSWGPVDAGIAAQSIALAAESLGLGSLIIGCIKRAMRGEKREAFSKALKLPEGYAFEVAVAVGHKAVTKEPHAYSFEKNVTVL